MKKSPKTAEVIERDLKDLQSEDLRYEILSDEFKNINKQRVEKEKQDQEQDLSFYNPLMLTDLSNNFYQKGGKGILPSKTSKAMY